MNGVTQAWHTHEDELRQFLLNRLQDPDMVQDLLQDVFVRALAQGNRFCSLDNPRAWLFRVTRNRLTDFQRRHKHDQEIPEQLAEKVDEPAPLLNLARCLPTALTRLSADDQEIIELCDLEGMHQLDYARQKNITLTATKSRIQRARKRLKIELKLACKIVLDEQGNVCCFDADCSGAGSGQNAD